MSKAAEQAAYRAGQASASVMWSSDDSVEEGQRDPGPHHCPFAEGDPQRAAWLRGLADALEAPKDHAKLVQSIRDEIKVADRAR